MKKLAILLAAGLGVIAASAPATAAPMPGYGYGQVDRGAWENINARQARLDARIDQGVRSGALTRREAAGLRAQFNQIASLEARYRRSPPGLTVAERRDLDRRFDALSNSIHVERHDSETRDNHGRHR